MSRCATAPVTSASTAAPPAVAVDLSQLRVCSAGGHTLDFLGFFLLTLPLHLNERPIATALPRRPAVIDNRIGDEGVGTADTCDSSVSLSSPCSLRKNRIELQPPLGSYRNILDDLDYRSGRSVVQFDFEHVSTVVLLPGVDQGQVGPILGILLKAKQPGRFLSCLAFRYCRVREPVTPWK
jgi:hypothetical protein